jgi:hypothetical protein
LVFVKFIVINIQWDIKSESQLPWAPMMQHLLNYKVCVVLHLMSLKLPPGTDH